MELAALTRPVKLGARRLPGANITAGQLIRAAGALPHLVVLAGEWEGGDVLVAADPLRIETRHPDPFSLLDSLPPVHGGGPPGAVGGGWFGWIGFEPDDHALAFYPNVMRRRDGKWWDEALIGLLDDRTLAARREQLAALLSVAARSEARPYKLGPVTASRGQQAHTAAVERCIQHIRAGESYQANICLTLSAEFAGSTADLAADLLDELRPPYGGFLSIGGRAVASASPELFLRRDGRQVTSRPIKGTRARSTDPQEAAREAKRLAGSLKDRAENVMIVDLVRNDLSRVAEIGSVQVPQLLEVVAHPGVWHLESTVTAQLAQSAGDSDLLRAAFPPGSVSGAPKARAVQIIRELEDGPRGVYTGAIGYCSPSAGSEFNVAIRTLNIADGRLSLGVGGGITVDSTPVQEWWECFDKARPLLRVIGGQLSDPATRRSAPDPLAARGICDTTLVRHGVVLERAEHLARLERSMYELYQQPLPQPAIRALLTVSAGATGWERRRIDITPAGAVTVTRAPAPAPKLVTEQRGEVAVVVPAAAGFGAHKWADRRRLEALEAGYPGLVVIVADDEGVLESTRANVIAICGGALVTAPLDGRILPGVTRTVVLDIARDMGLDVTLRAPQPDRAQAIAVVSSVAGLRWIRRCGDQVWNDPGDGLRELSRRLVGRWRRGSLVPDAGMTVRLPE